MFEDVLEQEKDDEMKWNHYVARYDGTEFGSSVAEIFKEEYPEEWSNEVTIGKFEGDTLVATDGVYIDNFEERDKYPKERDIIRDVTYKGTKMSWMYKDTYLKWVDELVDQVDHDQKYIDDELIPLLKEAKDEILKLREENKHLKSTWREHHDTIADLMTVVKNEKKCTGCRW